MKCQLVGSHIKVFAKAVHSLARLGDELYVEPTSEGVSFRTVNSSRSAFGSYFFGESFFSQYESSSNGSNSTRTVSSSQNSQEHIKCKVAMKGFLNAFKSISSVEKTIERVKLSLDGAGARLVLHLYCKRSITRNYILSFIECETLKAVFDESQCNHLLTSQSKFLNDIFLNFHAGQDEVSLSVNSDTAALKNYVDDEPDPSSVIRTEMQLERAEFDEFQVDGDNEVVFCLKELKSLLNFTEAVCMPITARFSQPGSPIIFCVDNLPLYQSRFVLATLVGNPVASQATAARTSSANSTSRTTTVNNAKGNSNGGNTTMHHTPVRSNDIRSKQAANNGSYTSRTEGPDVLRGHSITSGTTPCRPEITDNMQHTNGCSFVNGNNSSRSTVALDDEDGYDNPIRTVKRNSNINYSVKGSNQAQLTNINVLTSIDSRNSENDDGYEGVDDINNDLVDETVCPPPVKKRRFDLFSRCFNATYDPKSMPGFDVVLAANSDDEDT